MNIDSLTKKMLIVCFFIALMINVVHAQNTIGQTEITKWQYGKKGAVSITYDDGTINQFRVAIPIMNRVGLPGTFYIVTGWFPDAKYPGRFIGRPVDKIIEETKTIPTNKDNLFERASAARYLGFRETITYFNRAGSAINSGRIEQACTTMDDLYKKIVNGELAPDPQSGPPVENDYLLTWDMVKTHAAEGHEFASHMITHPYMCALDETNLKYELEKSREEILKHLGIRYTFSAELPYGIQDKRALAYAHKIYFALRNSMPEEYVLELHRPNRQSPINNDYEYVFWERGIVSNTTLDEMNGWVDTTAVRNNIWLITVIHGIDGIGWEPLTNQTVETHFSHIKSKENDLWLATFGDVSRYIQTRMNTTVTSSQKGETIHIKLTNSLNKKLYDIPLTLKTYVNPQWNEVAVKQGKSVTKVAVKREDSAAYILYQAMPGKETVLYNYELRIRN
jgi:peptidoglycan/xylan/chitin deacetylase (PgdA/CDA1 family)